jgi:hypothetical protein
MIAEFEELSQEEIDQMFRAPILVAVLIAGADGKIDNAEIEKAVALSKLKQSRARQALIDYYREIGETFEKDLREYIVNAPDDADERNAEIITELKKLNPIMRKIDKGFALKFYQSLKDIAKNIAEASGGVLGYMSVSYAEAKLIGLKMLKDPSEF